jgi:hypothetical protein
MQVIIWEPGGTPLSLCLDIPDIVPVPPGPTPHPTWLMERRARGCGKVMKLLYEFYSGEAVVMVDIQEVLDNHKVTLQPTPPHALPRFLFQPISRPHDNTAGITKRYTRFKVGVIRA